MLRLKDPSHSIAEIRETFMVPQQGPERVLHHINPSIRDDGHQHQDQPGRQEN